jgi:hypothetical protein
LKISTGTASAGVRAFFEAAAADAAGALEAEAGRRTVRESLLSRDILIVKDFLMGFDFSILYF